MVKKRADEAEIKTRELKGVLQTINLQAGNCNHQGAITGGISIDKGGE